MNLQRLNGGASIRPRTPPQPVPQQLFGAESLTAQHDAAFYTNELYEGVTQGDWRRISIALQQLATVDPSKVINPFFVLQKIQGILVDSQLTLPGIIKVKLYQLLCAYSLVCYHKQFILHETQQNEWLASFEKMLTWINTNGHNADDRACLHAYNYYLECAQAVILLAPNTHKIDWFTNGANILSIAGSYFSLCESKASTVMQDLFTFAMEYLQRCSTEAWYKIVCMLRIHQIAIMNVATNTPKEVIDRAILQTQRILTGEYNKQNSLLPVESPNWHIIYACIETLEQALLKCNDRTVCKPILNGRNDPDIPSRQEQLIGLEKLKDYHPNKLMARGSRWYIRARIAELAAKLIKYHQDQDIIAIGEEIIAWQKNNEKLDSHVQFVLNNSAEDWNEYFTKLQAYFPQFASEAEVSIKQLTETIKTTEYKISNLDTTSSQEIQNARQKLQEELTTAQEERNCLKNQLVEFKDRMSIAQAQNTKALETIKTEQRNLTETLRSFQEMTKTSLDSLSKQVVEISEQASLRDRLANVTIELTSKLQTAIDQISSRDSAKHPELQKLIEQEFANFRNAVVPISPIQDTDTARLDEFKNHLEQLSIKIDAGFEQHSTLLGTRLNTLESRALTMSTNLVNISAEISRKLNIIDGLGDQLSILQDSAQRVEKKLDEQSNKLDRIEAATHRIAEMMAIPQTKQLDEKLSKILLDLRISYQTAERSTITLFLGQPPVSIEKAAIRLTIDKKVVASTENAPPTTNILAVQNEFASQSGSYETGITAKQEIELENIFAKVATHDKPPHRLLVLGRAGIGKSTLCKYIANRCAQNMLWKNQFKAIFWIPLRNLNNRRYPPGLQYNWMDVINQECFGNALSPEELKSLIDDIGNNPIQYLFLFDGWDELMSEAKTGHLEPALTILFNQACFLTTARPEQAFHLQVDRRLEVIGFTSQDIEAYINNFRDSLDQTKRTRIIGLFDFLKNQHLIWEIARIPLQLVMICKLAAENKLLNNRENKLTLSELYLHFQQDIFTRFISRVEPMVNADPGSVVFHPRYIRLQKALERLAYQCVLSGKIIFSREDINLAIKDIDLKVAELFNDCIQCGVLNHLNEDNEYYCFAHLTFQEYFAASAVSCVLKENKFTSEHYQSTEKIIIMHRYNPRFQVVWWFVAGQLGSDTISLQKFFNIMLTKSKVDLLKIYERRLILQCILESGESKELTLTREKLLLPLLQILHTNYDQRIGSAAAACGELGSIAAIPQTVEALLSVLKCRNTKFRYNAATALGKLGAIAATPKVINALWQVLQDKECGFLAAEALGKIGISVESILNALVEKLLLNLKDQNKEIRNFAITVLGRCGAALAKHMVVMALSTLLADEDSGCLAADTLGRFGADALISNVEENLLCMMRHSNTHFRKSAAEALGKFGAAAAKPGILDALLMAIADNDSDVRIAAAEALGKFGAAANTPEVTQKLLSILNTENQNTEISLVLERLNNLEKLEPHDIDDLAKKILKQMEDPNENVQYKAISDLVNLQSNVATPQVINALFRKMESNTPTIQIATMKTLGNICPKERWPEFIQGLLKIIEDSYQGYKIGVDFEFDKKNNKLIGLSTWVTENSGGMQLARGEIFVAKNKELNMQLQKATTDREIEVVLNQHSNYMKKNGIYPRTNQNIREIAIWGLGKLGSEAASLQVINTLLSAMTDTTVVRRNAAWALGRLIPATATLEVTQSLLDIMNDYQEDVKRDVADALVRISVGPRKFAGAPEDIPRMIQASLLAMKNKSDYSRENASFILGGLGIAAATPDVIKALLVTMKDQSLVVAEKAAEAVGKLGLLTPNPKIAIEGLLEFLFDQNHSIRIIAAEVLERLKKITVPYLIGICKDYSSKIDARMLVVQELKRLLEDLNNGKLSCDDVLAHISFTLVQSSDSVFATSILSRNTAKKIFEDCRILLNPLLAIQNMSGVENLFI